MFRYLEDQLRPHLDLVAVSQERENSTNQTAELSACSPCVSLIALLMKSYLMESYLMILTNFLILRLRNRSRRGQHGNSWNLQVLKFS